MVISDRGVGLQEFFLKFLLSLQFSTNTTAHKTTSPFKPLTKESPKGTRPLMDNELAKNRNNKQTKQRGKSIKQ